MYNNLSNKKIKIPLVNKWYFALTLIFVLMRFMNIIDWSPIWLLSPLWLPFGICLLFISIPYILLVFIYGIEALIKYIDKIKNKWKK